MKTSATQMSHQLNSCLMGRQQAANELENEVNQILAATLLWIRFAKMENKLAADPSFSQAESNLTEAIERIRALHYSLVQDIM